MKFWRALSAFWGEEGNSNAEMCILLPVYILMTYGMFFLGELGLAQQAAEKSARSAAWKPSDSGEPGKFFRAYPFPNKQYSPPQASSQTVSMFAKKDLQEALSNANYQLSPANNISADKLLEGASDLLNGLDKAQFKRSEATIRFSFGPKGLLDIGQVNIQAYHVVDLPTYNKRTTRPKSGGKGHAVEDFGEALGN